MNRTQRMQEGETLPVDTLPMEETLPVYDVSQQPLVDNDSETQPPPAASGCAVYENDFPASLLADPPSAVPAPPSFSHSSDLHLVCRAAAAVAVVNHGGAADVEEEGNAVPETPAILHTADAARTPLGGTEGDTDMVSGAAAAMSFQQVKASSAAAESR